MIMIASENNPLDKLSVYTDYYNLKDEECLDLIRLEIANHAADDETYKIIVAERLRSLRRVRFGKYVTHVVT